MCFDKIITKKFTDEVIIEYGIVKGSGCILLIKVGRDGDIYGYENKYLKISKNINEKYGFSIVVASNFYTANCQVKCDTSCKKTSIADFQPRHFRGLELIRNRLCISSISFTRERSVFLG